MKEWTGPILLYEDHHGLDRMMLMESEEEFHTFKKEHPLIKKTRYYADPTILQSELDELVDHRIEDMEAE